MMNGINMRKLVNVCCVIALTLLLPARASAQQHRLDLARDYLNTLTTDLPGLEQPLKADLADLPVAEFLRGIARAYQLNIHIAPDVEGKMTNHFYNTTVKDALLFIADQHQLDFEFQGTIIGLRKYRDPLAGLPPPARPLQIVYDSAQALLTMDLSTDSLHSVVRRISQLTGAHITVMQGVKDKLVSGFQKALPLKAALSGMAISNRLKLASADGGFILDALPDNEEYVLRSVRDTGAGYSIARKSAPADARNAGGRLTVDVQGNNESRRINLSAVNTPLRELVKTLSEQADVPYFIYAELTGNVTAEAKGLLYEDILRKILLGTTYSFSKQDGIYMIGEKSFEGIRSQRLVQLNHRSVDSLMHFLPDDIRKDVSVKEFKELNAFLLTGPEPQLDKVERLARQLDRKVPLIAIEVIIMDINKGSVVKAGLKAGISDSIRTGGNLLGGGLNFTMGAASINNLIDRIGLNGVFNIGHVSPNFYMQLQAIENRQNVEMRQTPKLSTLNGHAATLSIGSTRYYAVTTQNLMGSLSPSTVTTQQFYPVEANLSLKITPFVSADEDVTLDMEMNISNFTENTKINEPPPTATSKFKTIIRVKNEDMVLLGGIERTEKGDSYEGIPLLGRIPVLKWLFSSRDRRNVKVVSIVFIKPTIIYN